MGNDLTTIATFWSVPEANLAKNHLASAGIAAFLSGEETVAMNWCLANALGIKLQVAQDDVERARACLTDAALDCDWQHVAETASETAVATPADEDGPVLSAREHDAERAWRGAILGLLAWPLQLFVFYLLLKIFFSEEPLRCRSRRHAWVAAAINLPIMAASSFLLGLMLLS